MTQVLTKHSTPGVQVQSVDDLARFGTMAFKSGLFRDLQSAAAAGVKIQRGLELNLQPMESLSAFHVMEGKIVMAAQLMGALCVRAGYKYKVTHCDAKRCTLAWKDPDGEELGEVTYTMQDAERAGLARRPVWQKHPDDMLFKTCVSKGARRFAPHVLLGCYAAEEMGVEIPQDEYSAPPQSVEVVDAEVVEQTKQSKPDLKEAQRQLDNLAQKRLADPAEQAMQAAGYSPAKSQQKRQALDADNDAPTQPARTPEWHSANRGMHAAAKDKSLSHDELKQLMPESFSVSNADISQLDALTALLRSSNVEELKGCWKIVHRAGYNEIFEGVKDYLKKWFDEKPLLDQARCDGKSCGRDILWGTTVKGKKVPVDLPEKRTIHKNQSGPKEKRYVLNGQGLLELRDTWPATKDDKGIDTYLSHHATCPDAKQFKKQPQAA